MNKTIQAPGSLKPILMEASGPAGIDCQAALLLVQADYFKQYAENFLPLFKKLHESDNDLLYFVIADQTPLFLEYVSLPEEMNEARHAELTAFLDGDVSWLFVAEDEAQVFANPKGDEVVPYHQLRGCSAAYIDNEGIFFKLHEKHTGIAIETAKLLWEHVL